MTQRRELPAGMTPRPLTPDTLAERWGCSSATIRNLCRNGELAHFRVGKEYRIPLRVVEGVEACGEKTCELSGSETPGTQPGETAEKPAGGRFVPKIVGLPSAP